MAGAPARDEQGGQGWRDWLIIGAGTLLAALALLAPEALRRGWLPGDAQSAEALGRINLHWQAHAYGLPGLIASDLQAHPFRTDRLLTDGFPLDALLSSPLIGLLGWPDGLWLWNILLLWGVGLSAGWLGARQAGAPQIAPWQVGLCCGVMYQCSDRVLWAAGDGATQVSLALLLLPVVLGQALQNAPRAPIFAGIAGGFAALSEPSLLPAALLLGAGPLVARRSWRGLLDAAIAGLVVVALPLAWMQSGVYEVPGLSVNPWTPAPGSPDGLRPVDRIAARIYGLDGAMFAALARPLAALLILLRVRHDRLERWRLPALLGLLACILGLGPELPGPLVLPSGWILGLPLPVSAGRADLAWAAVSLPAALLAAGSLPLLPAPAALRPLLAPLLALLFVAEARALSPRLPFPVVPLTPSTTARILAATPALPVLLLPLPGGRFRPDHLDLLDQTFHGRPLAHGRLLPSDHQAPDSLQRLWRQNDGLRALYACEQVLPGEEPVLSGKERKSLRDAGFRVVYIDRRYVSAREAGTVWMGCVARVLEGWTEAPSPEPFVKYEF